jgi:hypothetical protein
VLSWADREGNPFGSDEQVPQMFALLRGLKLNFISVSSMLKYLMQINWLGIEHCREHQLLSIEGVT